MPHITDGDLPWFLSQKGIDSLKESNNYVVFDAETTNKTNGLSIDPNNRLVLMCWTVIKDGKETKKYKFGDEYNQQEILDDIAAADFVVAHNGKFDLGWLHRAGIDLRDVFIHDTMSAEWVIQGNRKVLYSLDETAKRYGITGKESLVSKLIKNGICPSDIPRSWLLQYCAVDVDVCHSLFLEQRKIISSLDLWHIVLQRNLVVPVLADIELQGLYLDKDRVYEEEARLQDLVEDLGQQLDEITGGINLNSAPQLGQLLYDTLKFKEPLDNAGRVIKTGSGQRSASQDSISRLVASTKEQIKFKELYKKYNNANTLLTKNVRFFKLVCDEKDCRFFGQLRQNRTANHRLASSGIKVKFSALSKEITAQIQNLPRPYKRLFTVPSDDYEVTEYDGSQIEFRVAAELGHDSVAEGDIVHGVDIHSFTRDTMNAAYKELKVAKEIDRQEAKPHTFAPLAIAA
jgi:DNA polymerase-1